RPIAEDVLALPRLMRAAIDVTAGDRDPHAVLLHGRAVGIDHDRLGETGLVTGGRVGVGLLEVEALVAFHATPTHVVALGNDVDLFPRVLLHVTAHHPPVTAHVKRATPWVAHTVSPDLRLGIAAPHERIVGGNAVGLVDVKAQDLAVNAVQVLAIAGHDVVANAPVIGVAAV